jgi:hypothetical protein
VSGAEIGLDDRAAVIRDRRPSKKEDDRTQRVRGVRTAGRI